VTVRGAAWSPKLVLAIARMLFRGPVPGFAPFLAASLTTDPTLSSSLHRAAIALGALSVAESVITGDHQLHWERTFQDPSIAEVEARLMSWVSFQNACSTLSPIKKHVTEAINKSFSAFTQLGSLATSAVSYWHVVAGNGALPVASSAAMMGAGLAAGLAVTCFVLKTVLDADDSRLRTVDKHSAMRQRTYRVARKEISEMAEQWPIIAAYAVTGTSGVAGVMTGLVGATRSMDSPAWQSANFFPMLCASYSLMKAQVDMMRRLKSTPAPFVLVQADTARDRHHQKIRAAQLAGTELPIAAEPQGV
jgi:hypothetical protein